MHDVYVRARVLFFYVRAEDRECSGLGASGSGGYGEQSGLFVDDDEVVVLIDDTQLGVCELCVTASGRDGDEVSGSEGEVMPCLDGVADSDASLGKELFDG